MVGMVKELFTTLVHGSGLKVSLKIPMDVAEAISKGEVESDLSEDAKILLGAIATKVKETYGNKLRQTPDRP